MAENQPSKVSPNCQALDLFSFVNLTVIEDGTKQHFKCKLNDENEDIFITNVWIVGYITNVKIVKKNDDETNQTLFLRVSDGCYQIDVVQFKTSLSEKDFELGQYYSFIIRPYLQKSNNQQQQQTIQNSGALISYHKIDNYNEVTAHISESIRTFYFLLAPFASLVVKVIKAYSSNNLAISEENLKAHLRMEQGPDYENQMKNLTKFIGVLKDNGSIEQNDQGYLMVDKQQS